MYLCENSNETKDLTNENLLAIEKLVERVVENSIKPITKRLDGIDAKLNSIDDRLEKIETRLGNIEMWVPVANTRAVKSKA